MQDPLVVVEKIVARHRDTPGAAIPILQGIQNKLGYVSPLFLQKVAELTDIPASDLYGIVTFYSQFRLDPVGRNHVQICHGTACHLAGAEKVTDVLEHETKTSCGCTSADKEYTLEKVACIGCCSLAPVININGKIHGHLTAEKTKKILKGITREKDEGEKG